MNSAVKELLGLLEKMGSKGAPLKDVEKELANSLEKRRNSQELSRASETIEYALDSWLVDKTIDYRKNERGFDIGEPKWFIRSLSQEESDTLKKLPDVKKAVIRILRNSETEYGVGTMREDELLSSLRESGFNVDYVPKVKDIVSVFYKSENDHMVAWLYIVPEDERSEEYKQAMHEAAMRAFDKEDRKFEN